jgi:hypothetical protein
VAIATTTLDQRKPRVIGDRIDELSIALAEAIHASARIMPVRDCVQGDLGSTVVGCPMLSCADRHVTGITAVIRAIEVIERETGDEELNLGEVEGRSRDGRLCDGGAPRALLCSDEARFVTGQGFRWMVGAL